MSVQCQPICSSVQRMSWSEMGASGCVAQHSWLAPYFAPLLRAVLDTHTRHDTWHRLRHDLWGRGWRMHPRMFHTSWWAAPCILYSGSNLRPTFLAREVCAILAGLVVSNNFDVARKPLIERAPPRAHLAQTPTPAHPCLPEETA